MTLHIYMSLYIQVQHFHFPMHTDSPLSVLHTPKSLTQFRVEFLLSLLLCKLIVAHKATLPRALKAARETLFIKIFTIDELFL